MNGSSRTATVSAFLLGAVLFGTGGFWVGRGAGPNERPPITGVPAPEITELQLQLDGARIELAKLRAQPAAERRTVPIPRSVTEPSSSVPSEPRDPKSLDGDIRAAFAAGDGALLLELLGELANLGAGQFPLLAEHWMRLANLDEASLETLGLSRLGLASALARFGHLAPRPRDQRRVLLPPRCDWSQQVGCAHDAGEVARVRELARRL